MVDYLILMILHLVGDFYLQTTKIAQCKNARKGATCGECNKCKDSSWINWKYLIVHSLLYTTPFAFWYFIMSGISVFIVIFVLFVTHMLIDMICCYFNKKRKQTIVFIIDQVLHVGILFLLPKFATFDCYIAECYYVVLKVVFTGLMLMMPCSVIIKKMFEDIYPSSDELRMYDVGEIIGILERILTFILACFASFPTIAIIITVKTWARTNDLKNAEFRNKYLLGTLTSLILALMIFTVYKTI